MLERASIHLSGLGRRSTISSIIEPITHAH
jgi:hypothetical protein